MYGIIFRSFVIDALSYMSTPCMWLVMMMCTTVYWIFSRDSCYFMGSTTHLFSQVRLIDAGFLWTEPHSKRIKMKVTIQKEVRELSWSDKCGRVTFKLIGEKKWLWTWDGQHAFHLNLKSGLPVQVVVGSKNSLKWSCQGVTHTRPVTIRDIQ